MKKFHVRDEEGNDYTVEEMIEEKTEDEDVAELTSDEIASLKKLASFADKLISLVDNVKDEDVEEKKEEEVKDEEECEDEDEEEITDEDEEEEITDEDEEEIVDTDEELEEKEVVHDSKASAASIKKKSNKKTNDAFDYQSSVASAWAKRYQGGND